VPDDREEHNRVLGIPLGADKLGVMRDEQQRALGFPAEWFRLPSLARIRAILSGFRRGRGRSHQ
jgi:hypothetical protein